MRPLSPRRSWSSRRPLFPLLPLLAAVATTSVASGCVDNAGLMVILGNQIPMADAVTHICSAAVADATLVLGQGVLDLDVGTPQAYVAYPIVQNRLEPLGMTSGVEPNRIMLEGFHLTLIPPPGFNFPWTAEAPNHLEPLFSQGLEPGAELTAQIEAVSQNQAKAIFAQFGPGGLSPALTDDVVFTVEMHAVGARNGDTIESDVFRFPIRMCVGCLQTGFTDLAQYNYPGVPLCTVAPKPNIYKGNQCNFAQDSGPLLCCLDDSHKAICPSPDM